jgi:hypothetical protein
MNDVPVKFVAHGSKEACDALKWQARRVMLVLENIMQFGELDQHQIKFVPYDGALIVARKFFGTRVVDIYAGPGAPIPKPPEQKICPCNCNISLGWILEVQTTTMQGAPLYTVMACNTAGTAYVPYYDVLASDWTPYVVGQKVVMAPYNMMAYLCCTAPAIPTGCVPTKSTYQLTDDEWRSTYRILPVCALRVPVLVSPTEWRTS